MRILQVVKSSLPPGGKNNAVHHLSETLAARGHDVTLLALQRHPRDRESILSGEQVRYRPVLLRMPRTRGYFHDMLFTRGIHHLASQSRFDLVHAHMLFPEGYCAVNALAGLDLPLAVTGHGDDIQVDPSCGYGVRLEPAVDMKVRTVLARATALIAICEEMKREMVEAGADAARVSVIRWGTHLAPMPGSARPGAVAEKAGYVLSVGRFVPKKGYDLLVRAMRIVVDSRPEEKLIIAGEGPELESLRRLAAGLGLSGHIEFVGFVTGSALTSLYRGARLFVCPSRWEPLGLVNLEAMSCGLPVVAFNLDGIPEIVRHGVSGLLAAPGDPAALASAILKVLQDDTLRGRLSAAATESSGHHRWDRVAESHERLYEELITKRGSARTAPARRMA